MINLDDELAHSYLAESSDHLVAMERDLLALETGGEEIDDALVNRVFRAVHSIKGGAGFFDLAKIRELAHETEHAMALIRSRKLVPTPDRIGVLLRATDRLAELIRNPAVSNQADIAGIKSALVALCAGQAEQNGGKLRVLLVEDDFASRLLLQTYLARYGECHIAVNGREAVDAFRAALDSGQSYDLVCMDIMMPEMDGREAVRQIRAMEEARGVLSTSGAKIIMTTAVDDIKEVIRCFQELCDAYLVKPVDLTKLLGYLKSFQLLRSGEPLATIS